MDSGQLQDDLLLSQETFDHLLHDIGNGSPMVCVDKVDLHFDDEAADVSPHNTLDINIEVMQVQNQVYDGSFSSRCEPLYGQPENVSQQSRSTIPSYIQELDNSGGSEQQYDLHQYFGNELYENQGPSYITPTEANATAEVCLHTDSTPSRSVVSPSLPLAMHRQSYGSAIPSNTDYPGPLNFRVTFPPSRTAKSATWTYSTKLKKLYCQMSKTCPAEIRTSTVPPQGTVVRIMAVFKKSEHISEVVRRCPNHQQSPELNPGSTAPVTHLIRVEGNPNVRYDEHPVTGRQSVVMLLDAPQVGTDLTKVMFCFMCNTSCLGSMNRRPIFTVFTIENPVGQVLGRFCCETRVCASPGRDIKMDEHRMQQNDQEQQQHPVEVQKSPSPTTTQKAAHVVRQAVAQEEAETQTSQPFVPSAQPQPVECTPQVPNTSCSSRPASGDPAACTSSQGCRKIVHELLMTAGSRGNKQSSDQEQMYTLMVQGKENFEILKKVKESLELIRMLPQETIDMLRSIREKQCVTVELRGKQPSLSRHGSDCSQDVLSCSQGSDRTCMASSSAQNGSKVNMNGASGPPQSSFSESPLAWSETLLDGKPNNMILNFLKQMDCPECVENFTSRGLLNVQEMKNFTLQDLAELGVPEAKRQRLLNGIQEHHASTAAFSETRLKRSLSEETVHLSQEDDDRGIDTKDGGRARVVPALKTSVSNLSSVSQQSRKSGGGGGGEYVVRLRARQTLYLAHAGKREGRGSQEASGSKRRRGGGDQHSDTDGE